MFPILSLLRRGCASHAYIDSPELLKGAAGVRLDKPRGWYNMAAGSWEKGKFALLYTLSVKSDIITSCSKICIKENEVYKKLCLDNVVYTMLFGLQEYADGTLSVPVGIVRGIWRRGNVESFPSPNSPEKNLLPKGAVVMFH